MDWHYHPQLSPESELNYISTSCAMGEPVSGSGSSALPPVLPVPEHSLCPWGVGRPPGVLPRQVIVNDHFLQACRDAAAGAGRGRGVVGRQRHLHAGRVTERGVHVPQDPGQGAQPAGGALGRERAELTPPPRAFC